jgi:hypothetical protein
MPEIHTPETDEKNTLQFIHPMLEIHTPETDEKNTL